MDVSPEAIEVSRRKIRAAGVFAEHTEVIVAKVGDLPADHVVVAVVTSDYEFNGVHFVSRTELVERVPALEGEGWAMVFSHGADAEHVGERTTEMANLALKRIEMIERLLARG